MAANAIAAPGGRCNNPACARQRARFAGMCANAAIERKKRLDVEVRNGVEAARRGNVGGHGVMEAEEGREQYLLQNRLAGLKAIIEQSHGDEWREKTKLAQSLWVHFQQSNEIPDPDSEDYPKWEALNHILQKATRDHSQLECMMCMNELTADEEIFLGKNCYCLYHKSCVLNYARMKSRELGDSTLFEWVGEERVWNQEKLGRFPAAAPLPCAKCKDPAFCSSDHWRALEEAIPPVLRGEVEGVSEMDVLEPEDAMQKARADNYFWLLEVPNHPEITMLVPGKVPYDPTAKRKKGEPITHGFIGPDRDFDAFNFGTRLKQCKPGFKYDFDGTVTGAKCYYRPKQPTEDDGPPTFDKIPPGAELAFTKPKKEGGIPSYKLDLPKIMHPNFMSKIIAGLAHSTDDEEENAPIVKSVNVPSGPRNEGKKRVRGDFEDSTSSEEDEEPLNRRQAAPKKSRPLPP